MRGPNIRRGAALAILCLTNSIALVVATPIVLTRDEASRIGRQIWENECGGSIAGLTSWNAGEDFASLGIGHFIWYPAEKRGPFAESFPRFIEFARDRGAKLPALLAAPNDQPCPWNTRAEFLSAQSSAAMIQLRNFLASTIALQTDFLVERSQAARSKILAVAPASEGDALARRFEQVGSAPGGCYALVDYVNFKGEGVLASERYRHGGWGLLQVLEEMHATSNGPAATREFSRAAEVVLRRRVADAPPARHEERWLTGWLKRVATYRGVR